MRHRRAPKLLYPNTLCLLGSGVVINPEGILGEIDGLESRGISCDMLRIDPRAHVIMPWHLLPQAVYRSMISSRSSAGSW